MKVLRLLSVKALSFLAIIFLPFDQLFTSIFPNANYSPFRWLTIVLGMFIFRYNDINRLKPLVRIFYYLIAYCCLSFVSVTWSSDPGATISYSAQISVMLLFSIVALSTLSLEKTILSKLSFFSSLIGGVVSGLALMGFFSVAEIDPNRRLSFLGIGVNAVAISIGYALLLGICYFFSPERKRVRDIIVITASLIMIAFILRTGTRSAVWGIFIAIGLSYLLSFNLKFRNILRFIFLSIFLIISANYLFENYLGNRMTQRILAVTPQDIKTNVRFELWQDGIDWFSSNLLGTGAGNEQEAYLNWDIKEAHNVFVSSLIQLGIPALLIMLIVFVTLFIRIIRIKIPYNKFTAACLYFFLLIQMMKGSFVQTRIFWIPLILIMLIIILDYKNLLFLKRNYVNLKPFSGQNPGFTNN